MFDDFDLEDEGLAAHELDPQEIGARERLRAFFEGHRRQVFFSRQLEVQNEELYFHWITNRAIRDLESEGLILSDRRALKGGGRVKLLWHRSHRYYKRDADRLLNLVEEYSDPNIGAALGLQGEALVLEGFARLEFVMKGRNTSAYTNREWLRTAHDIDFIFEKDSKAYGVEVKNTLGYMDRQEFEIKVALCQELGVRPVFAVRMLPKSWIYDLVSVGGFALILKYQLYPWAHRELARRVTQELGLPVDSPRALAEGTMARLIRWHNKL